MKEFREITNYFKNPCVLVYTLLRISSAIFILFNPVWGFFLTLFFDFWDGYFYEIRRDLVDMPRSTYHFFDKFQDWIGYICMWIVSYKYNVFGLLSIFFLFRLLGQVIFIYMKKQWIFVIFPNFIDASFLWFIVFKMMGINLSIYFLYLLFIISIAREISLHIYWPNRLRKYGYPLFLRKYFKARNEPVW